MPQRAVTSSKSGGPLASSMGDVWLTAVDFCARGPQAEAASTAVPTNATANQRPLTSWGSLFDGGATPSMIPAAAEGDNRAPERAVVGPAGGWYADPCPRARRSQPRSEPP